MAEDLVTVQEENERLQRQIDEMRTDRDESIALANQRQREIITLRSDVAVLKQRDTLLMEMYTEAVRKQKTTTRASKPNTDHHSLRETTPTETIRSFMTSLNTGSTQSSST